jgi:hypothetical protein
MPAYLWSLLSKAYITSSSPSFHYFDFYGLSRLGEVNSSHPFLLSRAETQVTAFTPAQRLITMQDAGRESAPANVDPWTENQDEEHQMATTAIYDITDACFDILERLVLSVDADSSLDQALVADPLLSDESPRDIRGLRNSFAFWIDYTGALAPVGASLDDRLHSHDDIQEMVVELLEMVEKNLCRCELSVLLRLS